MVSTRLVLALAFAYARADELRDLLVATARGASVLKGHLSSRTIPKSLLSQKDEFGFSALAVATYLGDYLAAELLVKEGAALAPGEITAFMGDSPVKLGSIVELAVRRSSMLIMLGTGLGLRSSKTFQLENLIKGVEMFQDAALLARIAEEALHCKVPDVAQTLRLVATSGAQATEKSQEEGADLARAAYFLDSAMVGH
ncbi:jmjd6-a [Symbiodinium pilosum]|uniref:Jmjd6-a protein n=1 Tax=Symbiodinium pilosum TaxID=2952 RepID=A0A812IY89_SYMPI|nr:jmjd6-a [Symbiodinium pilosum]